MVSQDYRFELIIPEEQTMRNHSEQIQQLFVLTVGLSDKIPVNEQEQKWNPQQRTYHENKLESTASFIKVRVF